MNNPKLHKTGQEAKNEGDDWNIELESFEFNMSSSDNTMFWRGVKGAIKKCKNTKSMEGNNCEENTTTEV